MSTISKSELAREFGISLDQLRRELAAIGFRTGKRKLLWPSEVAHIRRQINEHRLSQSIRGAA